MSCSWASSCRLISFVLMWEISLSLLHSTTDYDFSVCECFWGGRLEQDWTFVHLLNICSTLQQQCVSLHVRCVVRYGPRLCPHGITLQFLIDAMQGFLMPVTEELAASWGWHKCGACVTARAAFRSRGYRNTLQDLPVYQWLITRLNFCLSDLRVNKKCTIWKLMRT